MSELDFEQRQEVERLLIEAQDEDRLMELLCELVRLRDDNQVLVNTMLAERSKL